MCLNAIFETAIDNEFCDKNPIRNVKVNSNLESAQRQTYAADEVERILEFADTHRYGLYIRILLELGLRCSELCGLKWSDFNLAKKTVSIKRACTEEKRRAILDKTKNKSSERTLPISTELCERLKMQLPKTQDEFLMKSRKSKNGMPISPRKFSEGRYKTFFADMGFEKTLIPHECRHTVGTLMYERSHDIYAVSKFLGHANIQITAELYVHEDVEVMRDSLGIK